MSTAAVVRTRYASIHHIRFQQVYPKRISDKIYTEFPEVVFVGLHR